MTGQPCGPIARCGFGSIAFKRAGQAGRQNDVELKRIVPQCCCRRARRSCSPRRSRRGRDSRPGRARPSWGLHSHLSAGGDAAQCKEHQRARARAKQSGESGACRERALGLQRDSDAGRDAGRTSLSFPPLFAPCDARTHDPRVAYLFREEGQRCFVRQHVCNKVVHRVAGHHVGAGEQIFHLNPPMTTQHRRMRTGWIISSSLDWMRLFIATHVSCPDTIILIKNNKIVNQHEASSVEHRAGLVRRAWPGARERPHCHRRAG